LLPRLKLSRVGSERKCKLKARAFQKARSVLKAEAEGWSGLKAARRAAS
jgi:hypothetical protein